MDNSIIWSEMSKNLFHNVETTENNLQVNASPGSGKTTNCKEIWRRFVGASICYTVFSKANADEAKQKLPYKGDNSFIGTMHSLGMGAINNVAGKGQVRVDTQNRKVNKLIWDLYPFNNDPVKTIKQGDIRKLVGLMKQYASCDATIAEQLISQFDLIDFPELVPASQDVYTRSLHDHKTIDFDDMLLFPVIHDSYKTALPKYDLTLGDEGQDFNPVQIELLASISRRLVVVGDPRQAIYGFRGALNNSLEVIQDRFQATVLPLSVTYRCPVLIVQEAQRFYPDDILPMDNAPRGNVQHIPAKDHMSLDYRQDKDSLIVCRNMAPLVQFAYALLRQRIPVRLRGRDIGKNLINFIKRLEGTTIIDMLTRLDQWRYEQETLAHNKGDEYKLQDISDKYDTVHAFVSMCDSSNLQELFDAIDALFEADYGVQLSTIHRAKGLEANTVYFLYPDLLPSKYAKQPWQITQENNLSYVAITRSKHNLIYLNR